MITQQDFLINVLEYNDFEVRYSDTYAKNFMHKMSSSSCLNNLNVNVFDTFFSVNFSIYNAYNKYKCESSKRFTFNYDDTKTIKEMCDMIADISGLRLESTLLANTYDMHKMTPFYNINYNLI